MSGAAMALGVAAVAVSIWPAPRGASWSERRPRARAPNRGGVALALGLAAAVVLVSPAHWWLGMLVAGAVLVGARWAARRRRTSPADLSALAVCCDLMAACLDAGMPVASAVHASVDALRRSAPEPGAALQANARPEEVATRPTHFLEQLTSTAAMLDLGADPDVAWRSADEAPELAPLAAAARRSARGGTPLAQAVRHLAQELRDRVAGLQVRAAGRAGVTMTAPLALCFLPGFVCLGLAPVIIGLFGQLDLQ
jgi:pilus assembly protein TadC